MHINNVWSIYRDMYVTSYDLWPLKKKSFHNKYNADYGWQFGHWSQYCSFVLVWHPPIVIHIGSNTSNDWQITYWLFRRSYGSPKSLPEANYNFFWAPTRYSPNTTYSDIGMYVKSTSNVNPKLYKIIITLWMFYRTVNIIELQEVILVLGRTWVKVVHFSLAIMMDLSM